MITQETRSPRFVRSCPRRCETDPQLKVKQPRLRGGHVVGYIEGDNRLQGALLPKCIDDGAENNPSAIDRRDRRPA